MSITIAPDGSLIIDHDDLMITESAKEEASIIVSDVLASIPDLEFVNKKVASKFCLAFECIANHAAAVAIEQQQMRLDAIAQAHSILESQDS